VFLVKQGAVINSRIPLYAYSAGKNQVKRMLSRKGEEGGKIGLKGGIGAPEALPQWQGRVEYRG